MIGATYNGYSIPNVLYHTYSETEKRIDFSCNFLLKSATASGLITLCDTAREKLTEKNKNLKVTFGTTEIDLSHSSNTGFLARPTLSKVPGSKLNTETTREYSFAVSLQLPFSQSGYDYRQEASFVVRYDASRRKEITFSMIYTAGGSDSALTKYTSSSYTYAANVLSAIGGDYELVFEQHDREQENKIIRGTLRYLQILDKQSSSSADLSGLVNPSCSYIVEQAQRVGYSPSGYVAIPDTVVSIAYNATLDKDVVSDATDIESLYRGTIRPWLISHAGDVIGVDSLKYTNSAGYILLDERKSIDAYNYTINGRLTILAPNASSAIIEVSETVQTLYDNGYVSDEVLDGIDYSAALYSYGRRQVVSRNISIAKLGAFPQDPPDYAPSADPNTKWILRTRTVSDAISVLGDAGSGSGLNSQKVYTRQYADVWQLFRPINTDYQG